MGVYSLGSVTWCECIEGQEHFDSVLIFVTQNVADKFAQAQIFQCEDNPSVAIRDDVITAVKRFILAQTLTEEEKKKQKKHVRRRRREKIHKYIINYVDIYM